MITIYGKDNCTYCTKAKNLLKVMGREFDYKDIGKDNSLREELMSKVPTARTVPQIFFDETYIGGYDDMFEYLKSEQ